MPTLTQYTGDAGTSVLVFARKYFHLRIGGLRESMMFAFVDGSTGALTIGTAYQENS